MLSIDAYNQKGEKSGKINLPEEIFGVKLNSNLIHQTYVAQEANARIAVAHTKTRGEVRGGGAKPWKQKGTGRARHGSIRSPLWIGGGITFGPRSDRNFSKNINKKQKQKALFMALTSKLTDKEMVVVNSLSFSGIKTKDADDFLDVMTDKIFNAKGNKKTLVILPKADRELQLSFRNIQTVKVINADSLNVVDVLNYKYTVILKDSVEVIKNTYTKLHSKSDK